MAARFVIFDFFVYGLFFFAFFASFPGSVVDPDPYVFGPPGSVIILYGSGSGKQGKK
jgi:hypothetical protein